MKRKLTISANTGRYLLQEWNAIYSYWATILILTDTEGDSIRSIRGLNEPWEGGSREAQ